MSKLAKAIEATLTGNVKAMRGLNLRYTEVTQQVNQNQIPVDLAKEFLLQVKLHKKAFISDGKDAQFAMQDIKRAMIEEVFGEFRPMLIEIRSALYDNDMSRVRTLLAEIEHDMFHDGL